MAPTPTALLCVHPTDGCRPGQNNIEKKSLTSADQSNMLQPSFLFGKETHGYSLFWGNQCQKHAGCRKKCLPVGVFNRVTRECKVKIERERERERERTRMQSQSQPSVFKLCPTFRHAADSSRLQCAWQRRHAHRHLKGFCERRCENKSSTSHPRKIRGKKWTFKDICVIFAAPPT